MKDNNLKQFNELGLAGKILQTITAEGYTKPTPIQAEVIPTMLGGRDIVGIAQTGTGKTASFVLPLLQRILQANTRPAPKHCNTLILAPTRELAAQIAQSIGTYGRNIRHTKTLVIGGAKPGPQIKGMARGVDIIIATPGRLEDHLSNGALHLDHTTTVILDEADQMMDLGFLPAIRRIMAKCPPDRQTLLLSATMPKQIRALARDFLTNPAEISVAPGSRPIERIDQRVYMVERTAKRRLLAEILSGPDVVRAIVFTRTKRGADRVMIQLQKTGLTASAIHGNRSQRQRERTLAAFKSGQVNILVATDIAARGIDVDDVSHVVNFELPNIPEAYIHRIGRTARAGKSGVAISLCDNTERDYLRDIERLIGSKIGKEDFAAGVSVDGANFSADSGAETSQQHVTVSDNGCKDRKPVALPKKHRSKRRGYWAKKKSGNGGQSQQPGQSRHGQTGNGRKSRRRNKQEAA